MVKLSVLSFEFLLKTPHSPSKKKKKRKREGGGGGGGKKKKKKNNKFLSGLEIFPSNAFGNCNPLLYQFKTLH